jgi:hypothetical protein
MRLANAGSGAPAGNPAWILLMRSSTYGSLGVVEAESPLCDRVGNYAPTGAGQGSSSGKQGKAKGRSSFLKKRTKKLL